MQRIIAALTILSLTQITACDAPDDSEQSEVLAAADLPLGAPIDVEPATLDEAIHSLAQIDALLDDDPADARALAARAALRPRLDQLNHLVARVEPKAGHVVSFYEPLPGLIGVMERSPTEAERLLSQDDVQGSSMVDLYRRVAGEHASVPEALVAAQARAEENARDGKRPEHVGSDRPHAPFAADEEDDAVPLTQGDAAWWQANVCYTSGNANFCKPNWWNGGWAEYDCKTSAFQIAPFDGQVTVRFQYEGLTLVSDEALQGGWYGWAWNSDGDYTCPWPLACGTWDYNLRSHRWDILNASGDGFHWTARFNWTCTHLGCPDSV